MMIDAELLPVRTVTVSRKVHGGDRPYHIRERVRVVLARDLEAAKDTPPRTRLEKLRCMSLEDLAERLLTLHDGDAGSYCRMKDECVQALEENHPETVTEANCLECIKEWLMEEV